MPARLPVSCREAEWERIREIASGRGQTIREYMIEAALTVDPAPEAPALALSEDEQRLLAERVERLADGMVAEAGRGQGAIVRLRQSVELVLGEALGNMVRQGREDEILPLLIEVFGEEHGAEVERRFRAWMERQPVAG
ncbi:MAG: hypothetical protein OXI64_04085 [Defluviicoccus sp.]|nr:hypothetical protein [Defluviicoccus sp.]